MDGEYWRAERAAKREERRQRAVADASVGPPDPDFRVLSAFHWQMTLLGDRLDYFPSVRAWLWRKVRYHGGVTELAGFVRKRKGKPDRCATKATDDLATPL